MKKEKKVKNPYLHKPCKLIYDILLRVWAKRKCRQMNTTFDVQLQGLKPPFIVLANHSSIADYSLVTYAMKGYRVNLIGSVSQTRGGKEILFRTLGVLKKRQFVSSMSLVKEIKKLLDIGGVVTLYPEARLSGDGRCSVLPLSVAKMVKLFGVPVVTVKCEGSYLHFNKWRTGRRDSKVKVTVRKILDSDCKKASVEEIFEKICDGLRYNDWEYQKRENVAIEKPCQNMHTIIYRCPLCHSEGKLASGDDFLFCPDCTTKIDVDTQGVFSFADGNTTDFCSLYDAQVKAVEKEVESGEYLFEDECFVEGFETKDYFPLGRGRIKHDLNGFVLSIGEKEYVFESKNTYAIPYDCGSCIYLSLPDITYKITPKNKAIMCTKVSLAVEEIYKLKHGQP